MDSFQCELKHFKLLEDRNVTWWRNYLVVFL